MKNSINSNKKIFVILGILATIIFIVVAIAFISQNLQTNTREKDLIVGTVFPLSGDLEYLGLLSKRGVELATEEWNSLGGVLGQKILLVNKDDSNNPKETIKQIKALIDEDKALAIIGSISSETTIEGSRYASTRNVPFISPMAGASKVTVEDGIRKEFVFRVCLTDEQQARILTDYVIQSLNLKTAAILYDRKNPGLAESFKLLFEQKGRVLLYEAYSIFDTDFTSILSKIYDLNPGVILVADYYNRVNLITSQARELGIKSIFIGGIGWDSSFLNYSVITEGYFISQFNKDSERKEVKEFIEKYKDKYGEMPDTTALLSYEAANLLYSTMENLKTINRNEIQLALSKLKTYHGIIGDMVFDSNGNVRKEAYIFRIKDWLVGLAETIK